MSVGTLNVARKRTVEPSEPLDDNPGERPIAIQVRGWPAWKEWARRLAQHEAKRLGIIPNLNGLVGRALAHYAKAIGFKEAPPER